MVNKQPILWWRIFWRLQVWALGINRCGSLLEIIPSQLEADEWLWQKRSLLEKVEVVSTFFASIISVLAFYQVFHWEGPALVTVFLVLIFASWCVFVLMKPLRGGLKAIRKIVDDELWYQGRKLEAAQIEWRQLSGQGLNVLLSGDFIGAVNGSLGDYEQAVTNLADPSRLDFSSEEAFAKSVEQLIAEVKRLQAEVEKQLGLIRAKVKVAEKALEGRGQLIDLWLYVACIHPQFAWRPDGLDEAFNLEEFFGSCARRLESLDIRLVEATIAWLAPAVTAMEKEKSEISEISVVASIHKKPFETPIIDAWTLACQARAEGTEE